MNVSTSKQAASTSTQAIPISVKAITHHDLSFKAHFLPGIGFNGEIILAKHTSKDFHMIEHDGNKYTQKYRKNLPDGMDYGCSKAIDGDRIFLQNDYNEDTICCNRTLQTLHRVHNEGWLIDCIGDKLVYRQGTLGKQDWKLAIRQLYQDEESVPDVLSQWKLQSGKQVTLQPPAPHRWNRYLAICCANESYAVVEILAGSLDIFDANGMICIIQLIYQFIHVNN